MTGFKELTELLGALLSAHDGTDEAATLYRRRRTELFVLMNFLLKAKIRELFKQNNLPLTVEDVNLETSGTVHTVYVRYLTSDTPIEVLVTADISIAKEAIKLFKPGMTATEINDLAEPLRHGEIEF